MKRSSRLLLMMLFVLGVGTTITYGAELINERETEQIIANDDHLMNQIGNRRYVALSSNLIVTEPTKEEKMYVSSQRSKGIELNGFFDEPLELYLPQWEYLVDPITGRLQEVKSERVILKYK